MANFDTAELVETIVDQAHTIRRQAVRIDQLDGFAQHLNGELARLRARAHEAGVTLDEEAPVAIQQLEPDTPA